MSLSMNLKLCNYHNCNCNIGEEYYNHTYPQFWNRIIEKYKLNKIISYDFTSLPYYRFVGMVGDFISKNITTGPCLLTPKEIRKLNPNIDFEEVKKMFLRHPTFEDYVSVAIETNKGYKNHIIIETYEYAKLVEYKTNIPFEEALKLTKLSAKNFKKYYKKKVKAKYYLTHKKSFDRRLRELCNEHYKYYLENANISKKGKEIIKNNPEESTWLRIKVSFLPEAINKDDSTIVEPVSSIEGMLLANKISEVSGIVVRSPPTLNLKPIMNEGNENEIFYLNNDIEKEIKKLTYRTRTKWGCSLYHNLLFLNSPICCNKNCEECLEIFINKIKILKMG
ncbi:hypothetical protein [Methanocaldococcus jannaschii]|nr:hypothetical protein [Methanocaldococcus jannaschii]